MKPVPEFQQVAAGLFIWHGYDPECKVECFSTAVKTPSGFVLIDPVRLEEQAFQSMVDDDRVVAVLLTSGNHLRAAAYEKERLDVPIYAPEGARPDVKADHWLKDGETLFSTLQVVGLPGGAAGETAYLAGPALVLGDALINLDGLQILPDKYCGNARLLRESLLVLPSLPFEIVCFAHGLPLVENAREKVDAAVRAVAAGLS